MKHGDWAKCLKGQGIKAKALRIKAGSPNSSLRYLLTTVMRLSVSCMSVYVHVGMCMCVYMWSPQVHATLIF